MFQESVDGLTDIDWSCTGNTILDEPFEDQSCQSAKDLESSIIAAMLEGNSEKGIK